MNVTLTVEAADGSFSFLEATDRTYETALAAAKAQVPEGSRAIVIRT